jgi:phospholipid/cholesterol/gamma-HCH transport system ATP-binding protein
VATFSDDGEAPITAYQKPPVEIRVEGLHKSFGEHHVLRGVDLEVRRGDLVAIVGGSGCGKSVLLEHIIGALSPDKGRVSVADHSVPEAPLRDLRSLNEDQMDRIRRHWAVVFQRNALYSGTVRENCEFWLRIHTGLGERERIGRIRESLSAVGFQSPDDLLDKQRHELSGGMAKRVAIARAIAMHPTLLFYDEPTTGLDPVLAAQIQDLVGKIHNERTADGEVRTTVVITHDKDLLARLEPRVVMLHEGRVFFDGSFRAFEDSPSKIIRPYFELMPALHLRRMDWAPATSHRA